MRGPLGRPESEGAEGRTRDKAGPSRPTHTVLALCPCWSLPEAGCMQHLGVWDHWFLGALAMAREPSFLTGDIRVPGKGEFNAQQVISVEVL